MGSEYVTAASLGAETTNVNSAMTSEFGDLMSQWGDAFSNLLGNAPNVNAEFSQYDPMQGYNSFLNTIAPGLQNLISGTTSSYNQGQMALADTMANRSQESAMGMLANMGDAYTSNTGNTMMEADWIHRQSAMNNILGMQNQLTGSLYGNALNSVPGQYQYANQARNQNNQFNASQNLGLYGQQLGAAGGAYNSAMAGYAASPTWMEDTMIYQPSAFETYGLPIISSLFGLGGSALGGYLSGLD